MENNIIEFENYETELERKRRMERELANSRRDSIPPEHRGFGEAVAYICGIIQEDNPLKANYMNNMVDEFVDEMLAFVERKEEEKKQHDIKQQNRKNRVKNIK